VDVTAEENVLVAMEHNRFRTVRVTRSGDGAQLLLAARSATTRRLIRRQLATATDVRLIEETADARAAVALAARWRPDVVLLDAGLTDPDLDARSADLDPAAAPLGSTAAGIRHVSPATRVVLLGASGAPAERHIAGYLPARPSRESLLIAVRTAHRLGVDAPVAPEPETLSPREREVLALVAGALSNRQIANRLSITESTVKRHLCNTFGKLGAVSRLDAVFKAQDATARARHRR